MYQSSGTNLFSAVANNHILNAPANYIDVPGCQSYSEANVVNSGSSVSYGYLVNMGWVGDSSPFIYELYAQV